MNKLRTRKKDNLVYIAQGMFPCSLPEQRLIVAVFEQGFRDLRSTIAEIREDAATWLQSEHAVQYAEILGVNGEVLLRGVMYHLEQIGEPDLMQLKASSPLPRFRGKGLRWGRRDYDRSKALEQQLELRLVAK